MNEIDKMIFSMAKLTFFQCYCQEMIKKKQANEKDFDWQANELENKIITCGFPLVSMKKKHDNRHFFVFI